MASLFSMKILTHAEKMSIQRISPFSPLYQIKNGVFGLTGQCCAFEQGVGGFLSTLPRRPNDTTLPRVMKTVMSEVKGAGEVSSRVCKVRKKAVFDALEFLCKHHSECQTVTIDPAALDWLEGDEGVLDCHRVEASACEKPVDPNIDGVGPAPLQCQTEGDNVSFFGCIGDGAPGMLSTEDAEIERKLKKSVAKSLMAKDVVVDWPTVSGKAVDEFKRSKGVEFTPDPKQGLDCWVDASFAGLYGCEDDQDPVSVKSHTGFTLTLHGCPILCQSKLQKEIALSSTEHCRTRSIQHGHARVPSHATPPPRNRHQTQPAHPSQDSGPIYRT